MLTTSMAQLSVMSGGYHRIRSAQPCVLAQVHCPDTGKLLCAVCSGSSELVQHCEPLTCALPRTGMVHTHKKNISVQVAKRVAPLEFCAAPMVKHSHPPHPDEACGSAQEVSAASQELLERTSTSYEPMSRVLSASLGQIQVSGCKASQ